MKGRARDAGLQQEGTPIVVEFPLRGEWVTPNTPGKRVPSHGTDLLGQRYAYDFVRTAPESSGMRFFRPSPLRYLFLGVRLEDCFGWGQPIYSPIAGTVVRVADGWPEREPVYPVRDIGLALRNGLSLRRTRLEDLRALAGNHVMIEADEGYAFFAHAQTGSIKVSVGDRVEAGQPLANVGHSGNSTAPHLHFHLMDHPDPWKARGILCGFRDYEVLRDGTWHVVREGIPTHTERLRKL